MKNKTKIYFRVDANHLIGLGHLVRSLALAQMLKNNFEILFIYKEIPKSISDDIIQNNFSLLEIKNDEEFFEEIGTDDIIVLDGYQFNSNYQKKIKQRGAKLVCIDDLHQGQFYADLIINHNPGITTRDYEATIYTQFALGKDYVLLRPKFLKEAASKQRQADEVTSILICFGGADPKNLTETVIKEVKQFKQFQKIIVVTGISYRFSASIDSIANFDNRISHYHSISEDQILQAMLSVQLIIVPASGVLLEALAVGSRIISGFYIENQKHLYSHYKNINAFIDAGDFSALKIKEAITSSFETSTNSPKIIDGFSGIRLLKSFAILDLMSKVKIKKASSSDLCTTSQWARSPEIRSFSFNKMKISKEEHINWFNNKLEDCNCFYYIAEIHGDPVGSIRFDISNGEAIISYLVDSNFQGKGIGQILIRNGIIALKEEVKGLNLKISKISGYVLTDNIASIKTFQKLGFIEINYSKKIKFEKKFI